MTVPNNINKAKRKTLVVLSTAISAVGTGFVAVPFIGSWMPSEKAKSVGAPI